MFKITGFKSNFDMKNFSCVIGAILFLVYHYRFETSTKAIYVKKSKVTAQVHYLESNVLLSV
jgi:hypothetical protein